MSKKINQNKFKNRINNISTYCLFSSSHFFKEGVTGFGFVFNGIDTLVKVLNVINTHKTFRTLLTYKHNILFDKGLIILVWSPKLFTKANTPINDGLKVKLEAYQARKTQTLKSLEDSLVYDNNLVNETIKLLAEYKGKSIEFTVKDLGESSLTTSRFKK